MGELPPRLIVAHLGNGSSMTAIREGRSVDTTMGFSPTSGLLMGTRSGDLDPSVLLYLQRAHGMNADAMSRLVNKDSGLLGVSGESSDMRDLLALEATRPRAALAVDMYCYVARKFMAALIAALAGVDLVVFTGGIGEYGAAIRRRICSGLGFLGIELDDERNDANAPVVSKASRVTVRVMRTDEDSMIARHTAWVLKEKDGNHVHI
jgi:acetate kinase